MKQSSKERLATLLMDELLERLSTRESLRKLLGEMTSLPIDDVVEHLLNDFERAVEAYIEKHAPATKPSGEKRVKQPPDEVAVEKPEPSSGRDAEAVTGGLPGPASATAKPPVQSVVVQQRSEPAPTQLPVAEPRKTEPEPAKRADAPVPKSDEPQKKVQPAPSVKLDPIKLEFPKIRLRVPELPPVTKAPPPAPSPKETQLSESKRETVKVEAQPSEVDQEELRRLEEMAKKIEAEYATGKEQQQHVRIPADEEPESPTVEQVVPDAAGLAASIGEDDEEVVTSEMGGSKQTTRARYSFSDDDFVYVHAVGRIPEGESALPDAFMLEEKGIDGHEFAFALDYGGMRFYLSKINPNEMSVSKAMVLLLNKQESLQLQGVHESILNDLRGHGVLLPFEFGTVARGKDYFVGLLDKNLEDLGEALDDMEETTWWAVTASVLDSTIARIVGTDVQSVGRDRTRDRASYMSTPHGKKFDVKVLERILQREKKLAESIHEGLSAVAERSDVDTMVGLGSGSSEDWKVILKGSYDVPKRDVGKFIRTVTDLQYHHLQYDLMLALAGNREFFTLRRK